MIMNIKETNLNMNLSRMGVMNKINRIIIHHSGVDVDQSAKIIHDYHVNSNGWPAIGYHFVVRYNGDIERGRPLNRTGAHTANNNNDSIGICVTGNFSTTNLLGRPEQYNALVELVKYLLKLYPGIAIKKHNDYTNTQCPGNLFPWSRFLQDVTKTDNENIDTLKEENLKLKEQIRLYEELMSAVVSQLQKVLSGRP